MYLGPLHALLGHIQVGPDQMNARCGLRGGDVDGGDPAARNGRRDHHAIGGRAGRDDLISVGRGPGDLQRPLIAIDRLADEAGAVFLDRIGRFPGGDRAHALLPFA